MFCEKAERYIRHEGVNEGRIVLHSDLNNFFASVECLRHRALKAYPVAVCGSKEDRHGIVLAKNNLAKMQGVKTGDAIWQAKRLCPTLVVLEPHYDDYLYYSETVRRIYRDFSDRVEPFGLDEAWIELTGMSGSKTLADGVKGANRIRKTVYERTGLTVSVGVSDNKVFAKLASDYRKPDAVTLMGPDQYAQRIAPLAVGEMLFVGRSAQKRLRLFGIQTIGDAAHMNEDFFTQKLGKNGRSLFCGICGHDVSPVSPYAARDIIKSVGNSVTPPRDLKTEEDVRLIAYALCDKVCARLRSLGLKATTVSLSVRDEHLVTTERRKTVPPTDHAEILLENVMWLYHEQFDENKPARSLGVRTEGLVSASERPEQISLLDEKQNAGTVLDRTLDALTKKYGVGIVERALYQKDRQLSRSVRARRDEVQPFKSH